MSAMAKKITPFARPGSMQEESLKMIFEVGGKRTIINLRDGTTKVMTKPAEVVSIAQKRKPRKASKKNTGSH